MFSYKTIPDKWIRKAIFDAINGTTVNGENVSVHDFRLTVQEAPTAYVLVTGQTSQPAKTKCEYDYECTVLLEVVVQYPASGNTGSRLLNDNVCDMIRAELNTILTLDAGSGLKILRQNMEFGVGAVQKLSNYVIYRRPITTTFYVV